MSCQICCHEFQSLCNYLSTKLVTWLLNSIFCLRFTWTNLCEKQDLIFSSDNELTIYWYSSYLLNFLDLFVNLSREKFLITEAGFLLNSTCLEPPSVEPYKWDSTDITKWPVSIAHLKCLCHLWVLTKFAVGRTCEMIFFKWSWDDEFDDHTQWNLCYHGLSFLELTFQLKSFSLGYDFQSCTLGYLVFPPSLTICCVPLEFREWSSIAFSVKALGISSSLSLSRQCLSQYYVSLSGCFPQLPSLS